MHQKIGGSEMAAPSSAGNPKEQSPTHAAMGDFSPSTHGVSIFTPIYLLHLHDQKFGMPFGSYNMSKKNATTRFPMLNELFAINIHIGVVSDDSRRPDRIDENHNYNGEVAHPGQPTRPYCHMAVACPYPTPSIFPIFSFFNFRPKL